MSGTTEHGIRYPDNASKAKDLGPELKRMAEDVDQFVFDHAGPIARSIVEDVISEDPVIRQGAQDAVEDAVNVIAAEIGDAMNVLPALEAESGYSAVWRDRTWRVPMRITTAGELEYVGQGVAPGSQHKVAFYEDFTTRDDEIATVPHWRPFGTAATGQKWGVRGSVSDFPADRARIEDGVFTADATVYLEAKTGNPITRIGALFRWVNPGGATNQGALALIPWGDQGSVDGDRMSPRKYGRTASHLVITPQFYQLDYQDDPPADATVAVKSIVPLTNWPSAMMVDGATTYWVDAFIDRDNHKVHLVTSWAGTVVIEDPNIAWFDDDTAGPANELHACFEPFFNAPDGDIEQRPEVLRVWADHGPIRLDRAGIPTDWNGK